MNIGKARDPRVAMILQPKNLVIADGLDDSASRCMAVRNSVKRGTKSTPRMIASLKSNFVKNKKVGQISGKIAQFLANWTEGMLRDR
mmetsp:Transcript_18675/g.21725  ORF Transcript_18675/g.21725 Transcript_18675/m.21725 type:complete len:87 (+) Transcript_18675:27-287(+)